MDLACHPQSLASRFAGLDFYEMTAAADLRASTTLHQPYFWEFPVSERVLFRGGHGFVCFLPQLLLQSHVNDKLRVLQLALPYRCMDEGGLRDWRGSSSELKYC